VLWWCSHAFLSCLVSVWYFGVPYLCFLSFGIIFVYSFSSSGVSFDSSWVCPRLVSMFVIWCRCCCICWRWISVSVIRRSFGVGVVQGLVMFLLVFYVWFVLWDYACCYFVVAYWAIYCYCL